MSRFREEYYETRAYKAAQKTAAAVGKAGAPGAATADQRASRKEYFEKSLEQRKAITKAQAARLRGF